MESDMNPQETMDFIEHITGHGIIVEMCDFNDDECSIVKTSETIDDWIASRSGWQEAGEGDVDEHDGRAYAYFENAQVAKGQQRKDILVIDCGDYRIVYTG
jgi:hypothetical protein